MPRWNFMYVFLLLIAITISGCVPGLLGVELTADASDFRADESMASGLQADSEGDNRAQDAIGAENQTSEKPEVPLFVLSEGEPDWDPGEVRPTLADTTALTQDQVQDLLIRLPALQPQEDDTEQARLPDDVVPPPQPGNEVELVFPPPQTEVPVDGDADAPLAVLRYSPEGDVPLAPNVSVTFNQAMVALTGYQELGQEDVPVLLSPSVLGRWRWVGTRTLLFEADVEGADRMPMATEYTAEIPAGARSANGQELAEAVKWTFRTPSPTLQTVHPAKGTFGVEPVFFASFNQRIDPAVVIRHAQVTAGGRSYAVRLANAEEIAADARVQRLVAGASDNSWLAFVTEEPFPVETTVTVMFGAGTPSAEGPLVSAGPQRYNFQTPGTFVLRQHQCGHDPSDPCRPMTSWELTFSNPVDAEAFDLSLVSIEPEMEVLIFAVYDEAIQIFGYTQGGTIYTVTVAAGLIDRFGQTLGEDLQVQFRVGSMEASLQVNPGSISDLYPFEDRGRPIVVLDPYAEPTFSIYSVNIDAVTVRAFGVVPEQISDFVKWEDDYSRQEHPPDPPGELVLDRTVEISGGDDLLIESRISLSDALPGKTGHIILHIAPAKRSQDGDDVRPIVKWIQATKIGLDVFADVDGMQVWANRLTDGAPLPGVELSLWPGNVRATTDDSGMALLPLSEEDGQTLVARNGDDVAFLMPTSPVSILGGGANWRGYFQRETDFDVRYFVFDDRQMYRPGETVSIKGWVRQIESGREGDVGLLPDSAGRLVEYRVRDSSGSQIDGGSSPLNSLGGFHFQFDLPEDVNLGPTRIEMELRGSPAEGEYTHSIQVQEFRRPEFEVDARVSEGPHIAGGHALATISASYFAGGPLRAAEVDWQVDARSGYYRPPNWSGFTFGKWSPWWRVDGFGYEFYDAFGYFMDFDPVAADRNVFFKGHAGSDSLDSASFTSRTYANGEHSLRMDFVRGETEADAWEMAAKGEARLFPVRIDATATVMDVNRQAWSSRADLLVHPADRYVGLRSARNFVGHGEAITVEVVVTDIDGNPVSGHSAVLRASRLNWTYREGGWQEIEQDTQECIVVTTAAAAPDDTEHEFATCSFGTSLGGEYRITATVVDGDGRRSQTQLTRWVSGGQRPPSRAVEMEQIQLIPDGDSYAPGETARILVQAPFFPAEGLVTLRRGGIVSAERFTVDGPTYTLRVPIEESHIPNIHVQVNLVGAAARVYDAGNVLSSAPPRPSHARGRLNLSIPPLSRTLQVNARPQAVRLGPGGETTVDVTVLDANNEPVANAEFAVVVVDEAILALTGYQLLDPITVFYSDRQDRVRNHHSRASLQLAMPRDWLWELASRGVPIGAGAAAAPAPEEENALIVGEESILVRTNYDPLALFAPEVRTDENGHASVSVTLPDNLTRYRVMVVAVAEGKYFGTGESSLTARLPLMVRPSAPRFLNFGDSFELPVVLQNQTDEAMETHVIVRATNAELEAESGGDGAVGYAVTVPANDRVEVRFPTTTDSAGTARFQVGAIDANQPAIADAAEVDLPVYTPATTEAFAVYGEIDESGAILQTLRPPSEAVPNYGGLEVTISSTALQALTDAFIYLVRYPYECSEQIASRILGVAALRDVLTAFEAEGLPSPAEIEKAMERDLQTLEAMQDYSGGFPIWRRGGEVWPYHSVHVAHALARARQKGYDVPEEMLSGSMDYLRNVEDYFPSWYGSGARRGISSYALYVRKLLRDNDPSKARALISAAGLDNLSLESVGWLLFVLTDDPASQETVAEMRRFLNNRVTETAGAATIASGYSDGDYLLLHSSRRADAVLLEALVVDQPESDLITKLVRGLLGHRTAGRWGNTQENVWVLLAMDRYFNQFESQTPDFVARIWLGEQYAGGHAFEGRSAENVNLDVPMQYIQDSATGADGEVPLILQKEGEGRLYYRLGLRYAPTDLRLDPADHGFTVERIYEAVDDAGDVRRDEDGVWHIRAGARVRVKLTMAAPSRRVHVALVDPLPAGLEILNPELAVTGDLPQDPSSSRGGRWWWGSWYQHQNLRDERAEAFSSYLWAGVYEYSYMARATTPGAFVAPPAKAEEMYAPETFGRTGTDWVVVEMGEE